MNFNPINTTHTGRHIEPRREGTDPFDGRCALHLQRICGTCKHYQGPLRGGTGSARCARLEETKQARARAWDCKEWGRRNV